MKLQISPKYFTPLLHVIVWSILLILFYYDTSPEKIIAIKPMAGPEKQIGEWMTIPSSQAELTRLKMFGMITNIMCIGFFYLNAYFLYPRLLDKNKWWLYLICIVVIITVLSGTNIFVTLYKWLSSQHPTEPLERIRGKRVVGKIIFTFLTSTVYRLVQDKMDYEKALKERQAEQLSYDLKFLRSQINPHFLFNVLTNLVSLARKKSDRLEPSLIMLSDLMRYMLHDSEGKKISLSHEINYLKSYIELQRLRFGDEVEISTTFDVNGKEENLSLEPMLLIPFVENAFKHGTGWIDSPEIQVKLMMINDQLLFNVKNKCSPDTDSKDSGSGIGLVNVTSRLNLLYPDRHSLSMYKQEGCFYVKLVISLV